MKNQSAEVGTWSIYAGRAVELADCEAPGASHMVTTTAALMFRVERDAEAVKAVVMMMMQCLTSPVRKWSFERDKPKAKRILDG